MYNKIFNDKNLLKKDEYYLLALKHCDVRLPVLIYVFLYVHNTMCSLLIKTSYIFTTLMVQCVLLHMNYYLQFQHTNWQ